MWVITLPAYGTVLDYMENAFKYVIRYLRVSDTYLVFDRYYLNSIKETTRMARAEKDASRQHQLSMTTPLPPRKIWLTSTLNKQQLISLSCEYIIQQADQLPEGKTLILTIRNVRCLIRACRAKKHT